MSRAVSAPVVVGRYVLHREIASGGMAGVHIGRRLDGAGETVAIKRTHPHFARDPEFITMFRDEAGIAARIRHENVVRQLDFVAVDDELLLVMEYVNGESLARLARLFGAPIDPAIAVSIVLGALRGLEAAHTATTEAGEPLHIVHRDVSPQNIMVGVDGVTKVLDFGVAKAIGRLQATTRHGEIKGKVPYMAPEQLTGAPVDARADVYASGVLLWEALTGKRLFSADNDGAVLAKVLAGAVRRPRELVPTVPEALESFVMRALELDPDDRFASAREAATALAQAFPPATNEVVGRWVARVAERQLEERAEIVAELTRTSHVAPAVVPGDAVALRKRPPEEKTKIVTAIGVVAAAAAVTVGAATLFGWSPGAARELDAPPAGAASGAVALTTSARSSSESATPPPATSEPTASAPSPLASAASPSTAPPPPTGRPLRLGPTARGSAPPPATAPKKAQCDKPYFVDSAGAMHVRRECL